MNQDAHARAKPEGNPLIDGNLVTFVWEGESAPLLIGDFNGWEGSTPAVLEGVSPNTWAIWPLKRGEMRIDELNWMDVESYLEKDDRLVLIVGACEQHGYLSLMTDIKIPVALADAASKRSGVLVAPPLNFGVSPHFGAYPGTITLRLSTFLDAVEDMIRSVYRHGFRRLFFLNGHGGNDPARTRISEILDSLPGLSVRWYSWWLAPRVTLVAEKHGLKSYHAAWIEAFPFVRVADLPDGVKEPPLTKDILGAEGYRKLYGDGVFGGPYKVDGSILDEIFDVAVQDIIDLLTA